MQPDAVGGLLRVVSEEIVNADHLRTRTALQAVKTREDLSHVFSRNGTAPATVQARSSEWLEENGTCSQHLIRFCSAEKEKLICYFNLDLFSYNINQASA